MQTESNKIQRITLIKSNQTLKQSKTCKLNQTKSKDPSSTNNPKRKPIKDMQRETKKTQLITITKSNQQ